MSTSLLLDRSTWDLTVDLYGNIAMADEPYSLAQDVSTAIRTFLGECWYDVTLGMPYWTQILGKYPAIALIKNQIINVSLAVSSEIVSVQVISITYVNRKLSGVVQFIDTTGQKNNVSF